MPRKIKSTLALGTLANVGLAAVVGVAALGDAGSGAGVVDAAALVLLAGTTPLVCDALRSDSVRRQDSQQETTDV